MPREYFSSRRLPRLVVSDVRGYLLPGGDVMTAPSFRAVDQFSGSIAEASRYIDKLIEERDEAVARADGLDRACQTLAEERDDLLVELRRSPA